MYKGAEDIADAVEMQAGIYTAESIHQAELLQMEAAKRDTMLPVLLRLNAGSQFGMWFNSKQREEPYQILRSR